MPEPISDAKLLEMVRATCRDGRATFPPSVVADLLLRAPNGTFDWLEMRYANALSDIELEHGEMRGIAKFILEKDDEELDRAMAALGGLAHDSDAQAR